MIHYSLTDKVVDKLNYKPLPDTGSPIILLGTQIKNRYDEARLQFSRQYNIRSYAIKDFYVKGVPLIPRADKNYSKLFKILFETPDTKFSIENYDKLLRSFKLSCSECFLYLQPSVYPVNSDLLQVLTTSSSPISEYYNSLFESTDVPRWQNVTQLNLFILLNKS